ncbi:GntR family transcriptional regulator [Bradyrhizobium sp. SZCCHNS2005]|uniref:GntR family transcriptional regulator n=1 Tax=Bradyrhizobium sp. SZCCHNS2005 TaxID=3057303 RepID=UPI0028E28A9A|nr:GntR family transcriptional regulator [Bradyrhizobium sp. SZCCHNS2005]
MIHQSSRPTYQALKRKILDGDLPFGEPITVKALESEIGFSAIPIREALIALSAEDLIDFFPGRGFFTKHLEAEGMSQRLDLLHNLLEISVRTLPDGRQAALRRHLRTDSENLRHMRGTLYDNVALLTDIFDTYFLPPTAILARNSITQCARFLAFDFKLHQTRATLGRIAFSYLWLASTDQRRRLHRELAAFFNVRKARIPRTIRAMNDRFLIST